MNSDKTTHYIDVTTLLLEQGSSDVPTHGLFCVISWISFEEQGFISTCTEFPTTLSPTTATGVIILLVLIDRSIIVVALLMKLVIVTSYSRGFMTELMGSITMENRAYQGVASRTSRE